MRYDYMIDQNKIIMKLEKDKIELLETLKGVKRLMDSEDYTYSFDDLYERVSAVIAKYE